MKNTNYICPDCNSLNVVTHNKSELIEVLEDEESGYNAMQRQAGLAIDTTVNWHTVTKQAYESQHLDTCDCKQCFVFSCHDCFYIGYTIKSSK
jgi:hypothetical protein